MDIAATFLCTIALAVISIASGNADLSTCGSPPDIHGAVTPQLKTKEHALGTVIAYNCPSGLVSPNVCKQISVCKITKESGRAEWTVPEITCSRRRCEVLKSNDLLQIDYSNNQDIGSWAAFHCSRPGKLSGVTLTRCLENGTWAHPTPTCRNEEDKSISSTEPGGNSFSSVAQPSVNLETSTRQTTDAKRNEDCFCTYEHHDPLVKAHIGERTLKIGDTIRLHERVSFECTLTDTFLTWQNGLRLLGKVHMVCNTCKKWQYQEVPSCKRIERRDTIISFYEDLNVLPGGIATVQKGKMHRFFCSNRHGYPEWDSLQRKGVFISGPVHGSLSWYYVTYLDFNKEVNELSGTYECYVRGSKRERTGSTFLHLQVNETDTRCPPIDGSGIFDLYYSNQRRINSTVTLFCEDNRMRIDGRSTLTCLSNKTWSGDYPKCVDEEDKSISSTEPGGNSFCVNQPSVSVTEDCFCTYEHHDPFVKAQIGERTLEIGDKIRLHERVSLECTFIDTLLSWQNGLLLHGKVHMICNTCKKWQLQEVPICISLLTGPYFINIISLYEDLNVLPGGIGIVQKGKKHQFSCRNSEMYPEWDYGQRKGVSVFRSPVVESGTSYYATYLNFYEEVNELNGTYECYVRDSAGGRSRSTFLHLQVNDTDTCYPVIGGSGIFTLYYSNQRRINSKVFFHCRDNRMRIEGRSSLTCLPNGTWSGDYPKCVEITSCPEFPNSSEMRVTYTDGLSVGSWGVFECLLTNKYLSGSHFSICQRNGSWNNPFPLCEDKDSCPEFSNLPEVKVTYSNDLFVGSIATFECLMSNKHLIGKNSSVCQENRSWSNPLPSCEDSKCSIHDLAMSVREGVELDISNVTEENVVIGSRIKLKCIETSMMTGDSMAVCEKHGIWKLGNFQCVQQCLLNLDPSSHLFVEPKKDGYRMGEFIFVSCPPGEEMSKKVERLMCFAGRWSDSLPECIDLKKKDQY